MRFDKRGLLIGIVTVAVCFVIIGALPRKKASTDKPKAEETTVVEQREKEPEEDDKVAEEADPGEEPAEQPAEEPSEEAQVFETDQARVEYRETIDSTGNALVLFSFENKTDRTVMVNGEGVVANGDYQVTPLGGSDISGIQPGMTGQVSIVFGVDVQTPLSGVADLETISADLVMHDADNLTEEVGRVHVDVRI